MRAHRAVATARHPGIPHARAWHLDAPIVLVFIVLAAVLAHGDVARAQSSAGRSDAIAPPLTLAQLLDSVRVRYPLVQMGAARLRAMRAARTTAGTLANPIVSYQVDNTSFPGGSAPAMDREAMTTALFPLENVYQRAPRVRQADAEVRMARHDAAAGLQRASLDAARAYYRCALAQVGAEAARDLSSWLDTLVAYDRIRVREGVTAEADLLRAEMERDRASADASMREAEVARARADLMTFLDDSAPFIANVDVAVIDHPLPLPGSSRDQAPAIGATAERAGLSSGDLVSSDAVTAMLRQRPDLAVARDRLSAANEAIAVERTMFVRQLGATIGVKQSAGANSMIAGLSLPLPLFDQNRGAVARAAAERDASRFELLARERTARGELAGAYEAARLLTHRLRILATPAGAAPGPGYLARADDARRIALGAYQEGGVPLFQVLDVARAWGEARMTYYGILFAQHEAVIELLAAQGVDLQSALSGLNAAVPTARDR